VAWLKRQVQNEIILLQSVALLAEKADKPAVAAEDKKAGIVNFLGKVNCVEGTHCRNARVYLQLHLATLWTFGEIVPNPRAADNPSEQED
jgi:hypothetical protein